MEEKRIEREKETVGVVFPFLALAPFPRLLPHVSRRHHISAFAFIAVIMFACRAHSFLFVLH